MLNRKVIMVLVASFILLITVGIFVKEDIIYKDVNNSKVIKQEDTISMMVEQTAETGDYMLETRTSWPTLSDGYEFNSTLSKCENGSLLSWNNETNSVVMTGNVSDKCYVYFDKLKLITFTVSDTTFYAYDGMTWEAFINSDFNDGNFSISSDIFVMYNNKKIATNGGFVVAACVYAKDNPVVENKSYIIADGCIRIA